MTHEQPEPGEKGICRVCQSPAAGLYFGALVCLPCKSFYIRCTKDGAKLRCQQDPSACNVNKGRFKCQSCRFQACLAAGMQRKEEKPDVIDAPIGSVMCKVCDDYANGVHFGVTSCEGCKKFFRRGLTEFQNYACKEGGNCPITPRTRNQCRYCRYMACLKAGMSREAIKVGRPPSKKENARHHPYGQINLSTSHHETSPKLSYTNGNGFVKQEMPWNPNEPPSLSALPALIHGGGEGFRRPPQSMKIPMLIPGGPEHRQMTADLNSSCTSADINEMLLNCIGPHGEMPPLPAHFDLDEALGQIDGPTQPRLMAGKPMGKLQRIENLPKHNEGYNPSPGAAKGTYQLQPIKMENHAYREPNQMYSHPSPPYEANYEAYNSPASMYQSYQGHVSQQQQQSHGSPYNQQIANQGSPMSTLSHQNRVINQSMNGFPTQIANQGSPLHPGGSSYDSMDQSHSNHQLIGGGSSPYHSPPHHSSSNYSQPSPSAFSQPSPGSVHQAFAEIRQHRPSCDMVAQHQQLPPTHDPSNPYSQPQLSPYSNVSSPHSVSNTTSSGYATDSQDFLDEFSIYEVDIRQVNHKYMPSCSQEPLVFNEEALTVEDIWSKNIKSEEFDDNDESLKNSESGDSAVGSGMFKQMKSIDDKVNQDYWFNHAMPADMKYTDDMKSDMDGLMKGWLKTKEYVSSNLKTSSSSNTEDGKESLWPNVKENAPLQLKLMDFIKNRLLRETQAQARFYQEIRGSDKLPEKDKKTLVSTASFSNCLLMHVLYWWDEEREQCKYFWAWKIPEKDPFYVFRQTVLKFSQAIKDLNFDEKEIMLISALTLFSTDIIRIEKKDIIERERKALTDLCAAYMKEKYKGRYLKRYRDMLHMVPALRYLSIWHNDLMAFAKTFGPISDRSKPKPSVSESTHNTDYDDSVRMIGQLHI